jgi:hypothetical protein
MATVRMLKDRRSPTSVFPPMRRDKIGRRVNGTHRDGTAHDALALSFGHSDERAISH